MFRSPNDIVTNLLPREKYNEEEEIQRLQCNFCSKNDLCSETELLLHQSIKHENKVSELMNANPNYCRICIKDCKDTENLLQHLKVEHLYTSGDSFRVQREIFICDYCSRVFFNKDMLQLHFTLSHSKIMDTDVQTKCFLCLKNVNTRNIWFHLQSHNILSVSTCPICFVKCRNRKQLLDHMKNHPRHLKCDMCMYETKGEDFFRQHIIQNHKTNITCQNHKEFNKYFTPQCSTKWKYQKLGLHYLELTNDLRICILCREICVGESDMKQHICAEHNMKTVEVKPKHLCTCGEVFSTKVLLKHHTFKLKGDHKMLE